ncbi:glycosyltransferase family 2 protein [Glutamicibacter arilaitensis]|uniref:glycosyltransferase family 2 protein n=1 Tax=Glutamicibacter arilaitensis TaxID=256701 RepID=UPI003FD0537E
MSNDISTGKRSSAEASEATSPGRISVVVATHNRPELLKLAIAGVLEQDYAGDIELIVVFDKSEPDMSLAMAKDNRRIKVIANTNTPGLAGARNSGILAASGQYVAFCDDDDIWLPSKLRKQVALLEDSEALTAISGIVIDYGDHSNVRIPSPEDMTLAPLVRRRVMEGHPSSVIVKRDALLDRIGLVDEQMPGSYGEDYDWILRAVQAGPIAVAREPLVRVRWGFSQFSQRWEIIIQACDYLLAKHPVLGLDPRGKARLLGRKAFAYAALGHRKDALRTAVQSLRHSLLERRAYLALAVAAGAISAQKLLDLAHRRGRGI